MAKPSSGLRERGSDGPGVLDEAARTSAGAPGPGGDAIAVLAAAWTWLSAPETIREFRLFQQVAALARLRRPDAGDAVRRRLATDWQPLFANVFAADDAFRPDADRLAHLTLTFCRGLSLELVLASDPAMLRPSYDAFLSMLTRSEAGRA